MSRELPTLVTTLKDRATIYALWILHLTVGVTELYFAEGRQTIDGNEYKPYLVVSKLPRSTNTPSGKTASVSLDNVDLAMADWLADHRDDIQGAVAVLSLFYLEAAAAVVELKGRVASFDLDEQQVALELSGFDPNTKPVPAWLYSQLCNHTFRDSGCGYSDGLNTCDKTFAACTVRERTHRFTGCPAIVRDLTQQVEGQQSGGGEPPPGDGLEALY